MYIPFFYVIYVCVTHWTAVRIDVPLEEVQLAGNKHDQIPTEFGRECRSPLVDVGESQGLRSASDRGDIMVINSL